ncbi:hypothetical protein BA065_02015 [Nanoarchaeota archaeon NZ13-N]|nr:MAG: hypothetical protein BA065_02015 [Nanoarchaeota archaeon NZ13-N]
MQIVLREYQENILKSCLNGNTLIILPTGTGKTIIAFFVILKRLERYPDKKVFFLAPTKPLTQQHYNNFIKIFPEYKEKAICITGETHPSRREYLYKQAQIIFVTPQTLQNDLINGKVTFYNASTIIFDEAHRAIKKYAYTFIARKFVEQASDPRIIGLTASPGWNIDRIQEVINNLYIQNVEIRTGREEDIRKYIAPIKIEKIEVELDKEILEIRDLLEKAIEFRLEKIRDIIPEFSIKRGKKDALEWIEEIKKQIDINPDNRLKYAFLLAGEILKILHSIELLETQTLYTFLEYFRSMENSMRKSRADYLVLNDIRIKKAIYLAKNLLNNGKEHPKLYKLLEIIRSNRDKKIIVFAQIRKTLEKIKELLDKEGIDSRRFIGKREMGQKEQVKILKEFAEGKFNVLLATSIGEEGIDIPKVDIVIFYEPVPSEIRYIQRRGRTGRGEIGEVLILVTKKSIDERFYWVAINKERKMFKIIKQLKKYLKPVTMTDEKKIDNEKRRIEVDKGISKYFLTIDQKEKTNNQEAMPIIIADYKEKDSGVLQTLAERDIIIRLENLEVGDYIIGDFVIERKTILDFISSIADGRLYDQLNKLRDKNAILILEGEEEDIFITPELSPNYIRSLLLKIILEYRVPIIKTKNFIETSNYLYILAKSIYKKPLIPQAVKEDDPDRIRENILKQIPGIGDTLARNLLERFKTIKNIVLAKKVELANIIGESKADRLKKIFEEEYKSEK